VTSVVRIEPGNRVVVTGATGFIGSAVARALRARGAEVVALVAPGVDDRNLDGTGAERVVADIRDAGAVRAVCQDARFVFHLAAVYRFWARDPRIFYDVNVGGTLNVLDAVRAVGCERLVYTSTVGVLGLDAAKHGLPADETCYADLSHLFGHYKRSKFVAEHEVLRAAAQGLDVCLVLPTFPLGPRDVAPSTTWRSVTWPRSSAAAVAAATFSAGRTCPCGGSSRSWPTTRACPCRGSRSRSRWCSPRAWLPS